MKQTTMSRFLNSSKENDKLGDIDSGDKRCIEIKLEPESKSPVQMLRVLTFNGANGSNSHIDKTTQQGNPLTNQANPEEEEFFICEFPARNEEKIAPATNEISPAAETDHSYKTAIDRRTAEIVRRSRRLSICVELYSSPAVDGKKRKKENERTSKTGAAPVGKLCEEIKIEKKETMRSDEPKESLAIGKERSVTTGKETPSETKTISAETTNSNVNYTKSDTHVSQSLENLKTADDARSASKMTRRKSTFVERYVTKEKTKTEKSVNDDETIEISQTKKRSRESLDEPVNKAKRPKLTSESNRDENVIDEVIEDIWHVSVMTVNDEQTARFLVKWDGFDPSQNTYEPYEHVAHAEVLKDYVRRKLEIHQDKFDAEVEKLLLESGKVYESFSTNKSKFVILKKLSRFDDMQFKCNVLAVIYMYGKIARYSKFITRLRYQAILFKYHQVIQQERKAHELLAKKFMKKENQAFKITIENVIDYEPVPSFKYLREVQHPLKVQSNVGCNCVNLCSKKNDCCPKKMNVEFVYDVDKRICALSHQMIVECNENCSCNEECPNRPQQTRISLCVFKTSNRGWALKTLESVPAGTFVIEYTGELIHLKKAQTRSQIYNKPGLTYLFDLDYNEENEATYSIDATNKGNLSRFINHSCNANLQTWPATSCNENPKMHRLYYFSLRLIKAGEELTVDYSGGVNLTPKADPPIDAIPCKCGEANCKGYIF